MCQTEKDEAVASAMAFITLVRQVSEHLGTAVESMNGCPDGYEGKTVDGASFEVELEDQEEKITVTVEYLGNTISWDITS